MMVPVPLDILTYIGITISSNFEILDQILKYLIKDSEWMDLVSQES